MLDEGKQRNAEFEGSASSETDSRMAYAERACPACGALARRREARFCATCGRALDAADYFPTDSLKASYHQLPVRPQAKTTATRQAVTLAQAPRPRTRLRQNSMPFQINRNGASTTAMVFVTYALVPYLGILFCPGALLMGSIGLVRSHRTPQDGGRRTSVMSITLGLFLLGVQLLLWWILYKVPEWSQHAPF